jgi:hypothetical protein
MPQQQCPWCGRLGDRYEEGTPREERPQPHDDGSPCRCRHVTAANRLAALRDGGRYWDGASWVCPSCGTAPGATPEEERLIEEEEQS